MATRNVTGRVLSTGRRPVAGAAVLLIDADHRSVPLGHVLTDAEGRFSIDVAAAALERLGKARPDFVIQVYDARRRTLLHETAPRRSTAAHVVMNVTVPATATVAPAASQGKTTFRVSGTIVRVDGAAAVGAAVRVFDRDLRKEEPLGAIATDANGKYALEYTSDQFARAEKASADLRVAVVDPNGKEIVSSAVIYNASPDEVIDLVLRLPGERDPSEFESLQAMLKPLLVGVAPADLTEDTTHQDLSFLAGETGYDAIRLAYFAVAHRYERATGISAEVFYGLMREGLPSQLPALAAEPADRLTDALAQAISDNITSPNFASAGPKLVTALQSTFATQVLGGDPGTTSGSTLQALLATVLPDASLQTSFVAAYVTATGSIADFWQALSARPEFAAQVPALQFTLQMSALTNNSLPLVAHLQQLRAVNTIASDADLAQFGVTEWASMIRQIAASSPDVIPAGTAGATLDDRITSYATTLARIVEDAYPTPFVMHRLASDTLPNGADAALFLRNNPTFDLTKTIFEQHLTDHPNALDGLKDADLAGQTVKALQRLYRVAPRYTETSVLTSAGFDSAYAISRTSKSSFLLEYGATLGTERAAAIFDSAKHATATALMLVSQWNKKFSGLELPTLPPAAPAKVEGVPNWETLFGSLDMCACDDCSSVYSPAAYFVDVLHFLRDRKLIDVVHEDSQGNVTSVTYKQVPKPGGGTRDKTAKDTLFERRPDLGEIELTCDNTNVALPYVDLVNEALENAVAPPAPFTAFALADALEADLDGRNVSAALLVAFGGSLSASSSIVVVTPGDEWRIVDAAFTYRAERTSTGLMVTTRSLQTIGAASELAANPQYLNAAAYDALHAAVYPWTLPFDLWDGEARTYLTHLGAPRQDIMRGLYRGPATDADRDPSIAQQTLALSVTAASVVTGGQSVRLAATAAIAALSGSQTVDGVVTSNGELVLVMHQPSATDNGLYLTSAGAWVRAEGELPVVIRVTDGTTNKNTQWMVTRGPANVTAQAIQPWDYWGLQSTGNAMPALDGSGTTVLTTWIQGASRVRQILDRTGLAYADLVSLLSTQTINPLGTFVIVSGDPNDPTTCDTEKLIVDTLDAPGLDRLQRFVRLWRCVGWTIAELDHAICGLQADVVDPGARMNDALLAQMTHVAALAARFSLSIDQTLAFWAPIDVTEETSLYQQLFQNPAVMKPLDDAFRLAGAELAVVTQDPATAKISLHLPTVLAAIGIGAADVSALVVAGLITDDLTLANLSKLYGAATLAEGLTLTIEDLIALDGLMQINPFDPSHTEATLDFVRAVDEIQTANLTVAELDYLLRHAGDENLGVWLSDDAIAIALDEIRTGLRKVIDDNTLAAGTTDPAGDLTRKKLALLTLSGPVVDAIIAAINETGSYTAPLAALPAGVAIPNATGGYDVPLAALPGGFVFPDALGGSASYDAGAQLLEITHPMTSDERAALMAASSDATYQAAVNALFDQPNQLQGVVTYSEDTQLLTLTGVMTDARRASLLALSADAAFQTAINTLYEAPRRQLRRNLRSFVVPTFSASLASLPVTSWPAASRSRIEYVAATQTLQFQGAMTDADRVGLAALSTDAAYQTAIGALYDAPDAATPAPGTAFLSDAAIDAFFASPMHPADRYGSLLPSLLAYLRDTLSRSFVKQNLSDQLHTDAQMIDSLVTTWAFVPGVPSEPSVQPFLDPAFAGSGTASILTRAAFPTVFQTYLKLYKSTLFLNRANLSAKLVGWGFTTGPVPGWLNLNDLPLDTTSPAASFSAWRRLAAVVRLRDARPLTESLVMALFALANDGVTSEAGYLDALAAGTGWNRDDLTTLVGATAFGFVYPTAYQDERALSQLQQAGTLLKRLGVSAVQALAWTQPVVEEADARAAKQAAKAKYEEEEWLSLAKPLRDVLREAQRSALVDYLVARPNPIAGRAWQDVDDLYAYFLIDVQMSPCQLTSRIKQAISSAQLFVQRCLLHLETDVVADTRVDVDWTDWQWMNSYVLWEANRQVFLYPENWLEPDLRPDASDPYNALMAELMQQPVTKDTAEAALEHYLEQLNSVARLEIIGLYHQEEWDLTGHKAIDVLHVFGRTRGAGKKYYYRQRVDDAYWTPWSLVDLDIEGTHVIPFVWSRRLHLFWPVFTEKSETMTVTIPAGGGTVAMPSKYWELQLAWSEFRGGKWTPKQMSELPLVEPYHRPLDSFSFRLTDTDPSLRIGVYIRVSEDVDGQGLGQQYYRWHWADFVAKSPDLQFTWEYAGYDDNSITTKGTYFEYMGFRQNPSSGSKMTLASGTFTKTDSVPDLVAARKNIPAFGATPTEFQLIVAHQDYQFGSARPFFFQDENRTYFVRPQAVWHYVPWTGAEISPDAGDAVKNKYYATPNLIPDLLGPVSTPSDPEIYPVTLTQESIDTPAANVVTANVPSTATVDSAKVTVDSAKTSRVAIAQQTPEITALMRRRAPITSPQPLPAEVRQSLETVSSAPSWQFESIAGLNYQYVGPLRNNADTAYEFQTFYHPFVQVFWHELNKDGTDGLMQRVVQTAPQTRIGKKAFDFSSTYDPKPAVATPYPVEDVDYDYDGAYAGYNWELFFHVPVLIASRLMQNQQFADAQTWLQYIFDPTDTAAYSAPQRFWRMGHFFATSDAQYGDEQIQTLLTHLAEGTSDPDLDRQVQEWRQDPFSPHVIAELRTTAYQKNVVMRYLDNLIAWGDQLFRQDTIESINQATQLYVLAGSILGRRPETTPPRGTPRAQTFDSLDPLLDDFSNALVEVENLLPPSNPPVSDPNSPPPVTLPTMLYFCVPSNTTLLAYWDTVADRLFKIRHCMNIEGVVQQLPLFEPPLDPGMLVRAAAAGVDLSSVLNDVSAPQPKYRFSVLAQKASELAGEVKAFGAALLSALEKRDAEAIALLRSSHEVSLLKAVQVVKANQVLESTANWNGFTQARVVTQAKHDYYASRVMINPQEQLQLDDMSSADGQQQDIGTFETIGQVLCIIPNFNVPWAVSFGGQNLGAACSAWARHLNAAASHDTYLATTASLLGGHQRRMDDWTMQADVASKELAQIDQQIEAARIRMQIATIEVNNQQLQVDQAKETDDFLHSKYTNQDLYDWMVGQVSSLYFQSYQLAFDVARRAENAYRFELGVVDSSFVQFGYWDSLKKGLLAGERLHQDLKRMEASYLDEHVRELELTRHVSLASFDAMSLLQLKQTGQCFISLPETLFDLDCAGHYLRRLKNVSVSVPCVTGPYTSINCTLTLLRSSVRYASTLLGGKYGRAASDPRFADSFGPVQSIVTSSGQNDSGLFETNLRDERYLPFEGAGAISDWRIELPAEFRQFDYNTITDLVLHLRYTARDGGVLLEQQALVEMRQAVNSLVNTGLKRSIVRVFDLRQEFPSEFYRWQTTADATTGDHVQGFSLDSSRFAYFLREYAVKIQRAHVLVHVSSPSVISLDTYLTPAGATPNDAKDKYSLESDPGFGTLLHQAMSFPKGQEKGAGTWTLAIKSADWAALTAPIDAAWIAFEYVI